MSSPRARAPLEEALEVEDGLGDGVVGVGDVAVKEADGEARVPARKLGGKCVKCD